MKTFIQKHKLLSIFGGIAVAIVLSYAITYNMPDYFGIEGWYSLANNISISYIAALIFYVFQVYKPKLDNSKKASVTLKPVFLELTKFIEVTIECCRKYVKIEDSGKINISWSDPDEKAIYFAVGNSNEERITGRPPKRKTEKELLQINQLYKEKINSIKNRIDFNYCDEEIITLLSELESTEFYSTDIPMILIYDGGFYKFPTFNEKIKELEALKDRFKKSCEIEERFVIREADTIERAAFKAIAYDDALKSPTTEIFGEKVIKEYCNQVLATKIPDKNERKKAIEDSFEKIKDVFNLNGA